MLAIFKREFKNFFHNVIGWVFIAVVVFAASIFFNIFNLSGKVSNIMFVVVYLLLVLVFALPILVMKSLPEERKQKTDQLILTSPVSVGKIVLGKYLAMLAVFTISTLIVSMYLIIMSFSVTIDWKLNILALFGYWLYGAACLALSVLLSSFFESQVVSAIINTGVLLLVRYFSIFQVVFGSSENKIILFIKKVTNAIDFSVYYDTFLNGVFDLKVVIFFVSVIALCLFLTTQSIQKRRYTVSVKNFDLGAFSVIMIAAMFAVVIIVNIITAKIPAKYMEFDCTNNNLYQISDTTENIVKNLDRDINIYVYVNENDKNVVIDKVLKKYESLSDKIKVIYKDPDRAPMFYKDFTNENPYYNSLFIESGTKKKYISIDKLILEEQEYDENYNIVTKIRYDIEGQVTTAINSCITDEPAGHVYYTVGHNEYEIEARCLEMVEKQNIEYTELNLMGSDIPDDCDLLMIDGPENDFSDADTNKIIDYAKNGGKLFIVVPFTLSGIENELPNFGRILDLYGVEAVRGEISDESFCVENPLYPVLLPVASEFTNGVYDVNKYVFAPDCVGIRYDADNASVDYTQILTTGDNAISKTDLVNATQYGFENGDIEGPFVAGLYCKADFDTTFSECFVFGSATMFADIADQVAAGANSTVFLNCLNRCRGAEVTTINIPTKSANEAEMYTMNDAASLVMFLILWIVLPLVFIITGIVIWRVRSKR